MGLLSLSPYPLLGLTSEFRLDPNSLLGFPSICWYVLVICDVHMCACLCVFVHACACMYAYVYVQYFKT